MMYVGSGLKAEEGKMNRKSFGELIAAMARYNPHGKAITYGSRKIGWRELNRRVNRFAHALLTLGVKKGEHVVIMFHDCPEFIEANFALQKIGAVPVPMNFRFVAREIEYQTNHCDAVLYIFEDLFLEEVLKARPMCKNVKTYICCARGGKAIPDDMLDYEALMARNPDAEPLVVPTTGDDVCTICYTGGTTGLPKGVMLTYDNFWHLTAAVFGDLLGRLASAPKGNFSRIIGRLLPIPGIERGIDLLLQSPRIRMALGRMIPRLLPKTFATPLAPLLNRLTGGFKMFLNMPLFHMANYQNLIAGPISGLCNFVLRPSIHFDPREVLEIIERDRPMLVMFVPTQWKIVLDYPELHAYDRSAVLVAVTGTGVTPSERKKRILEEFPNAVVVDVFGQTEMTPDTTLRIDAAPEDLKAGSVGMPITGLEMRIMKEDGSQANQGEVGEILYRSPTVMKGYYGEEEKTAEVMRDGWFRSGDLGYLDEEGELIVIGRKTETINTGGEKVYPHEVEEILESHAKVEHACVIGVSDEKWGSIVRAVIVLRDGPKASPDELTAWCRDKLTGFKIPKSFVFAETLPVNVVGKVQRKQVKEVYGNP